MLAVHTRDAPSMVRTWGGPVAVLLKQTVPQRLFHSLRTISTTLKRHMYYGEFNSIYGLSLARNYIYKVCPMGSAHTLLHGESELSARTGPARFRCAGYGHPAHCDGMDASDGAVAL